MLEKERKIAGLKKKKNLTTFDSNDETRERREKRSSGEER